MLILIQSAPSEIEGTRSTEEDESREGDKHTEKRRATG
jgi:hypothetical protein